MVISKKLWYDPWLLMTDKICQIDSIFFFQNSMMINFPRFLTQLLLAAAAFLWIPTSFQVHGMLQSSANASIPAYSSSSFSATVKVRVHILGKNSLVSPVKGSHIKSQIQQLNRAFSSSGFNFKLESAIDYTRKFKEWGEEVS